MASYVVLARKWRPAQFADIVGQGSVVRTLMNAIRAERIHHAYLLTGSRGIGKTSIARIFSKALRCENSAWKNDWLHTCDQCSSCREIASSNSVDVIEIDGASNNGVDAVREIRESAKFLPSAGKRKIYIIDEVHMLTTAAFNALLKTLEEPPAHVVFIFATTEPHKIPATILSRCQRFDFQRVAATQIQERLKEVVQAEGMSAEPDAFALLARAAEGSMRDALSLLDQVIAFAGHSISAQAVRESIGLLSGEVLLGILKGVLERKPQAALALSNQAYNAGHDLRVLTRGLLDFLHALILAKVGALGSSAVEISEEEKKEIESLVPLRPIEELELFFQVLHHGLDSIARSPQPKTVLDILLIKCATAEALVSIDHLSPKADPLPRQTTTAKPGTAGAATALPVSVSSSPSSSLPKNGAASWEGFIAHVRQSRPLLASILDHGVCVSLPEATRDNMQSLGISFQPSNAYFHKQIQSKVYTEQLSTLSQQYFSCPVRIEALLMESEGSATEQSLASKREREQAAQEKAAQEAVAKHPVIQEAKALFGGELGPIELLEHERPERPERNDD